jgi:hypothetical protein
MSRQSDGDLRSSPLTSRSSASERPWRLALDLSGRPVDHRSAWLDDMKAFKHQWIFEAFVEHPTFFTKGMFGGLAAYVFERQMLVLVEPTNSGRWNWHGVLVCTDYQHHASIQAEFAALIPHQVLRKWLFIDSTHEDFETTMEAVAKRIASNDRRFGVLPKSPQAMKRKHTGLDG